MDALDRLTVSQFEDAQAKIVTIEKALRANRTHLYELKTKKRAEENMEKAKTVVRDSEARTSVNSTSVLGAL